MLKLTNYFLLLISFVSVRFTFGQEAEFENFVTVSGNKVMDGSNEFRFISFNIPNLNFVEDEFAFNKKHPYDLPTEYEINDAIESVKQSGGNVIRIYTVPVRAKTDPEDLPRYVLAPGKFDENSFKTIDILLDVARRKGIRIIFPLLNNWQWMGGRPQYADFRGKTAKEFWTDPQLIKDFKKTVKYVLNRKNTINGIKYKDDKTILCWETGNELQSEFSWTKEICRYIKSIDSNHLIMDGYHAYDGDPIRKENITEPSIDIVTSHHYELDPREFFEHVKTNLKIVGGKKPYLIGEFGFMGTPALEKILDWVIEEKDIVGALIWSLRSHRDKGGFYWHSEPMGNGIYKAYHFPGFASGEEYDEIGLMQLMRNKGFEIQNKPVPPVKVPLAPTLLPIEETAAISWQGSVGASCYDIERTTDKNGRWEIVGYNVSDAVTQYTALFNDKTAKIGKSYYYRVTAKNKAGKSEVSNVVGPVKITHQTLTDHMKTYSNMFYHKGDIRFTSDEDRKFKEIMYRLEGKKGTELIYYVPNRISSVKINSFAQENEATLEFFVSADGTNYVPLKVNKETYFMGKGDYGYWYPIQYKGENKQENTQYLKIVFKKTTQVSRIEVDYTHTSF